MRPDFIKNILTLLLLLAAMPVFADETNSPNTLDYGSFNIISTRNIFNPNRRNYRAPSTERRTQVDSFTLVGTMTYEKGPVAFFDGTSSEFRKPLKPADTIAGYRIADIGQNTITLLAGGDKTIKLTIGMQMKRTDGGPWTLLSHNEPVTSTKPDEPAGFSEKAANLNGAQSDVLKRMMMRRLKEQQ
jgi:hypothetical protein